MRQSVRVALALAVSIAGAQEVLAADVYSFSSAGASGTSGPVQAQINAAYTSTPLAGQVTALSTGIQQWIVPTSGLYTIAASGASGGYTPNASGGRGASITIQDFLTAGDTIQVLVGQEGGRAAFGGYFGGGWAGGGGGGTFIYDVTQSKLILAVGGGGGAAEGVGSFSYLQPGVDASPFNVTAGADGTSSSGSWSIPGVGGTNGDGGTKPGYGGAGGGGFSGDGQGSNYYSGVAGDSFLNGGLGGENVTWYGSLTYDVAGGFGGGAGAGLHESYEANAGGGGGYSGGGGGNTRVGGGGGGGNFFSGTLVSYGFNVGDGSASLISAVPEPETYAMLLAGLGLMATVARRRKQK